MRIALVALICLAGLACASADAVEETIETPSDSLLELKPKAAMPLDDLPSEHDDEDENKPLLAQEEEHVVIPGTMHVRPASEVAPAKPTVAAAKPEAVVQAPPKPAAVPEPAKQEEVAEPEFKVAKKVHRMGVFVDAHGSHVDIRRHEASSPGARRLMKARTDQYPDGKDNRTEYTWSSDPLVNGPNNGPENNYGDVRRGAFELHDTIEVTFRVPHDGSPLTNSQIVTLHGWATDPDAWASTTDSPNDPYAAQFHDPYTGTSGDDSRDGPRAGAQNVGPGTESFFAAWNSESTATNPRGKHDALKISWSCSGDQVAPAVQPYQSEGHAQGYRKSTGQRTSGDSPMYNDERASCSTTPDVTGFKPACLVHAYDSPPPLRWGAHALQDGPAITTVFSYELAQDWPANTVADAEQKTCTMTATDPYGKTDTLQVTINVKKELNKAPVASWKSGAETTYTVPHDHSPETHHVQVLLDGEYMDPDNLDQNFGPLGNTAVETTSMSIQKQLNWQATEGSRGTDGYDGIFVGNAPAKKYVGAGYCKEGTYSAMKNYYATLPKCQDDCADWNDCHTLWYNGTNCRLFSNCQNNDETQIVGTDGARYTKEVNLGTSWAMFRGRPDSYHPEDHMHGHGNDTVTFLWTCPTAGGEFFEQTLGYCREGSDAAEAYGGTDKAAYCRKQGDIDGDLHDSCQNTCLSTTGCEGFELSSVEYQGTCTASACAADTCELMMTTANSTAMAAGCPAGYTAYAAVGYDGQQNGNNNLHGNGARNARCFTRKAGQAFNVLKPVVSLPGPVHTPYNTWAEPGGQVGSQTSGEQWDATSVDHVCTLRVTDSYEATHTISSTITINREPNTLPVANAGADQIYTVPHDFNPDTNEVLVTLYGSNTTDGDNDKVKHVWNCTAAGEQTAWATVELPFKVQLGGINTGFDSHWKGGIQTGGADPYYQASASSVQTSTGWGEDSGNSGDGDLFEGTHSHQMNQVTVMLAAGNHTCTLTTTDTYNEASVDTVAITVNPEPDSAPVAE